MANFIHISEAASLALHSMILLAPIGRSGRINIKQIAEQTGASEAHLAKVFQRLAKAGLVHSHRGPNGGFGLAREPHDLSLLDIFEAIEGPVQTELCLLKQGTCLFRQCLFGGLMESFTRQMKEYLSQKTLANLVQSE